MEKSEIINEIRKLPKSFLRLFNDEDSFQGLLVLYALYEQGDIRRFYPYFSVELLCSLAEEVPSILENQPELDGRKVSNSVA